jgi:hypothetical protein
MSDDLERYEIFIKSITGTMNNDLPSTVWSWKRSNCAGKVLINGGSYSSLEASFAAARRHAAQFGKAPVKINLRESDAVVPPMVSHVPAAQRESMILDPERARCDERRTSALGRATPLPPIPIAALPPPDWSYAR